MKVYLIGHNGWIGRKYLELFKQQNIEVVYSDFRAETDEIKMDILEKKPTHILCCIGRTHGTLNGVKYNTIDYLQNNETLYENINDNLYTPLSLAHFSDRNNIHFTYIGTGCIFTYDTIHSIDNGIGFNEDDYPNFFGSNYSIVKGFTDKLMKDTRALNLRIRMPITDEFHNRNFITKITNYAKICSVSNSMSVLNELIPVSIDMMKNNEIGTFNFTNPGSITHNEILNMYKDIVDNTFKWENFTIDEQDKILLSKRSNNILDVNKLSTKYKVSNIKDAIRDILISMSLKK